MRAGLFARSMLLAAAGFLFWAPARAGDPASDSPYIDSLKQEMKDKGQPTTSTPSGGSGSSPYIDSLKRKMNSGSPGSGEQPTESYTEHLKKELAPSQPSSYTDQQKALIGPEQGEGAIEALKNGRSELHARKEGDIHSAAGFRIGARQFRDISSASGLQPFESIYGKDSAAQNFPLDFDAFYEYQPWHSEWWGSFGLFGEAGVCYYHGFGAFQFQVHNADAGGNFGPTSGTTFQFFTVPLTVGVDYRFNLMRLFRPFVMAGGTIVGFYEDRNDGGGSNQTDSRGFYVSGGVDILMDWLSKTASWDLYAEHGIKHYYLTAQYSRVQTFSGDVQFTVSGVYAGFTFEF